MIRRWLTRAYDRTLDVGCAVVVLLLVLAAIAFDFWVAHLRFTL